MCPFRLTPNFRLRSIECCKSAQFPTADSSAYRAYNKPSPLLLMYNVHLTLPKAYNLLLCLFQNMSDWPDLHPNLTVCQSRAINYLLLKLRKRYPVTYEQCSRSKYIIFRSGSRMMSQFGSGPGSERSLSIVEETVGYRYRYKFFKTIQSLKKTKL